MRGVHQVRDKMLGQESDDIDIAVDKCSGAEFGRVCARKGEFVYEWRAHKTPHARAGGGRHFGATRWGMGSVGQFL